MKNIKIFGAAIFIIMLLVQAGCSEDPVAPTDEKPIEALAAVEIGSGGGTVATDDVSITIPPGALGEKHNIAIYDIADDGAFGENTVSSSFKISGIPNDYTKPIKIKMKYNGELSGLSFIAVGSDQFDEISGDSSTVYDLMLASDSSGYLVSELPVLQFNLSKNTSVISDDPEFDRLIHAATAYNRLQTENFSINYPRTLEFNASYVGAVLEEAYSIVINDLGFSFNNFPGKWNVAVVVQKEAVNDDFGFSLNKLNISRDMVRLGKYSEIKLAMGISLINLGMDHFYSQISSNAGGYNYYWLELAIKTWAEELFTDDPNFQNPSKFTANAMAPFNGMRAGAGPVFDRPILNKHSYGMSSMIKYLVDDTRFGKGGIVKTYQDIGKGVDPIAALIKNMDAMVADWWPDFIKTYMSGDIYDVPKDYFLDNTKLEWNINDENDTLKIFAASDPAVKLYPDLSAKLFKISLNYANFDASSSMLFSMKGPVTEDGLSLVVFGIQNGEQVYLGTASAQDFEIPKLKEYYDNGMRQFLVALVNSLGGSPFLGESDIDLTIKVNSNNQLGGGELDFNRCSFGLSFNGIIKETTPNGTSEDERSLDWDWYIYSASGSFSGNTFTGGFNERSGEFVGTITATLNDEHTMITNFEWTFEYRPSETTVANYLVTGKDLPSKLLDLSDYRFGLSFDSNVCSHLLNVKYKYTDVSSTPVTQELIDHSCDEYSRIGISFYKE